MGTAEETGKTGWSEDILQADRVQAHFSTKAH